MGTPPTNVGALDYAQPRQVKRRPLVRPLMLALLAGAVTAVSFHATFSQYWQRPLTQEYFQYTITDAWAQKWDPEYVSKPFVGRKYDLHSPLGMASFYVFVVAGAVTVLAIRNMRQRWRGDAS